ncbi:hypothetical protein CFOL_v3_06589 [Cephalotus follicularis]|uniref:Uncharacterized protein n=1 Tax=Cephalotus follicularis TaxID=3775 RepID=A0A1Q3B4Y2_CEPFO|nr:hypothetical protein CFOL_v3_06589 [Cephalotus follicularis]
MCYLRISTSDQNKNRLYYSYEDRSCNGFLAWRYPINCAAATQGGGNNDAFKRQPTELDMEDLTALKVELQKLREDICWLYGKLQGTENGVATMKFMVCGVATCLGFIFLMILALITMR